MWTLFTMWSLTFPGEYLFLLYGNAGKGDHIVTDGSYFPTIPSTLTLISLELLEIEPSVHCYTNNGAYAPKLRVPQLCVQAPIIVWQSLTISKSFRILRGGERSELIYIGASSGALALIQWSAM